MEEKLIMKNYTITVNGVAYNVQVEEGACTAPAAAPIFLPMMMPAVVPTAAPAAPAPAPAPAGAQGSIKVECQSAGKILAVNTQIGAAVKRGQDLMTLESMKMEIPVVAPEDGTVASILVSAGQAVEAGDVLVTLN